MKTSVGVLMAVLCLASAGSAGDPVSQTFAAPADRVWAVTEALLKQFGWDIDKADRSIGWIETKSRVGGGPRTTESTPRGCGTAFA